MIKVFNKGQCLKVRKKVFLYDNMIISESFPV